MFEKFLKSIKPNKYRYRIDINNDDKNEHVLSFHVSSKAFFLLLFTFFFATVIFALSVIAFSPIGSYISGIDYNSKTENIEKMKKTLDSLQEKVYKQDRLYSVIQLVVKDDLQSIQKFDSLFFDNYPNADTIIQNVP